MPSLNKCHLIGNLTRDPELRVTPKGTAICQFGMAINRTFKDESGASRDETTFLDCEAWSKAGETIAKYCQKGKLLYVEGRLKLDTWDDKTTGQKRSKIKIVVENFQFLGGRENGGEGRQADAPDDNDQTTERHTPPLRSTRRAPSGGGQDHTDQRMDDHASNRHNDIDEDVPF